MTDSVPGVGRPLSSVDAAPSDHAVRRRPGAGAGLLAVTTLATSGVAAAVAVDVAGRGAFPTHPAAAVALGAGAVAVQRAIRTAPVRSRSALGALAVSLVVYLWLGVAACALDDRVLAALWSAGWIPPNGLVVVVGLVAAAMPRSAVAVGAVTALATAATAALTEPTKPFEGLPTAVAESWSTRVDWLADASVSLLSAAVLAAFVGTVVRVVRAHPTERRHLVSCASTTSMGIGLVVMCVALAALRDPGDIDPSTGSVAYLVAIAFTAALAAHGNAPSRWPLRVVVAYWAVAVAVLVGIQASRITPATLGVVLTVATAAAVTAASVLAVIRLEHWSTLERPHVVADVPLLSPRENEVLALVAAGATNAGVAAELVLSERTVEQHLRSIFAKLDLGAHDSSNRRVRAAAAWWQHQASADVPAADGLA